MKFQEFIGIDVSKSHFDVAIHSNKAHKRFQNNNSGFQAMDEWIAQNTHCQPNQILFAFEHTGLYSLPLTLFFHEQGYKMALVSGLELKRSLGMARGKDDKADARAIAEYAYEKNDKLSLYQMPGKILLKLKKLLTYREKLVKDRAGFKTINNEYQEFLDNEEYADLLASQQRMIDQFDEEIKKVDDKLYELIKEDDTLYKQYKLINSIKGVGKQTALMMIVLTQGFTQFTKWRKFACYAGTAPFNNESGRFKGKTKVNHLANKKIKALLNCCATSAINYNTEMKMYYERRMAENKHPMSTLNIIRNKILARIFAVVHRQTPYVDTYAYMS